VGDRTLGDVVEYVARLCQRTKTKRGMPSVYKIVTLQTVKDNGCDAKDATRETAQDMMDAFLSNLR
jgi:hypothetical protein